MSYPSIDATTWVNPNSIADQSTAMQTAIDRAAGRRLILPDRDIYCGGLVLPHEGISIEGVRAPYSVTGLGTRLILPNGKNAPMFQSESYVNNRTYANYGATFRGLTIEGNRANQSQAHPLVRLRTARADLDNTVVINGSRGRGIEVVSVSANNTALASENNIPENRFSCTITDCLEEGFYARDGGTGKLADIFLLAPVIGFCGGGAVKKFSVHIERGAGVKMMCAHVFGNGKGNLRIEAAGLTEVFHNQFESTYMNAGGGMQNDVEIVTSGFGMVQYDHNIHWSDRAAADGTTWRQAFFDATAANHRISHTANHYWSTNFTLLAWDRTGSGRVTDIGTEPSNATEPANHANIRRFSIAA